MENQKVWKDLCGAVVWVLSNICGVKKGTLWYCTKEERKKNQWVLQRETVWRQAVNMTHWSYNGQGQVLIIHSPSVLYFLLPFSVDADAEIHHHSSVHGAFLAPLERIQGRKSVIILLAGVRRISMILWTFYHRIDIDGCTSLPLLCEWTLCSVSRLACVCEPLFTWWGKSRNSNSTVSLLLAWFCSVTFS